MKRFQLAIMNFRSTDLGETNWLYFLMCSLFSFRLPHVKKIIPVMALLFGTAVNAQTSISAAPDTAYQKVIAERTEKIINTLGIADQVQYKKAQQVLADQYFALNAVHDKSKMIITAIKAKQLSKEETDEAVKKEEERKSGVLKQQHAVFIAQLKEILSEAQIEKVKDGMTYRVLPVTWAAYMEMLLKLTQEQKDKMYAWLVEARELAMDEGSSEKKHAVFGKYKGRINNYLSAQGYDMKKEGEDWAKRKQAAKDAKQN
jgi:Protein of unknown function (DUF3826)